MTNLTNRIGLHTWTLDTTPLPDVLRIARETGYNAVELRHVDFVRCMETGMSNDEVLEMIRASGLTVSCVGLETGMLFVNRNRAPCPIIPISPLTEELGLRELERHARNSRMRAK